MRVRALSADGDYTFGQSEANFLIDTSAAVAQTILTRLRLWRGEWFLNTASGMPWLQSVLGKNTKSLYDMAVRSHVLATTDVLAILRYESVLQPGRRLDIVMTVETTFETITMELTL